MEGGGWTVESGLWRVESGEWDAWKQKADAEPKQPPLSYLCFLLFKRCYIVGVPVVKAHMTTPTKPAKQAVSTSTATAPQKK